MKFGFIALFICFAAISFSGCSTMGPGGYGSAHAPVSQTTQPGYSTQYRGYCVNHDLCDFHGGNPWGN
jgi:hypothetical protein